MVLDSSVPPDVGGNVQARLVSAGVAGNGKIPTGNQTNPIVKTQLFNVLNATNNEYTILEDTNASGNVISEDSGFGVDLDPQARLVR